MYSEDGQKIKAKVPFDLWKKVESLGFDNTNKAVINAFEKLVSDPELNIYGKEQAIRIRELKNGLEDEQKQNQELQIKIQDLEKQLEDEQRQNQELQISVKGTEDRFAGEQKHNQDLQIKSYNLEKELGNEQRQNQELKNKMKETENKFEDEQKQNQELQRELQIRIEEVQQKIKDLQKELEKAERREIYFEEMHNNYMMQVQTLINQKQIVAPGAKKPWWRFW